MRYSHIKLSTNLLLKGFKVNRVVRHFILADLVLYCGWGLVGPIFSVFVIRNIPGATLGTAGAAIGLYWLTRAIVQLPVATYLDKKAGEKDDFYALLLGLILASGAAFGFTLVTNSLGFFTAMVIQGIAFGLYAPSWSGIFNRHLDKERVAFDLSLDNTVLALASGVTALLGGLAAETLGFKWLFITASIFSLLSALIIFLVPDLILPGRKGVSVTASFDHTPKATSQ